MGNPHEVTKQFERELCRYTGAPFAVAVSSCTAALQLCCEYFKVQTVIIPKLTYVSVPQVIIRSGGKVKFKDISWRGEYQLAPYPIWDSARRFTSNMYKEGRFTCCSFHSAKILAIEQAGCIFHSDEKADKWFRRMRFDGRSEGIAPVDDYFDLIGLHCYLSPSASAQGILKLYSLPKHNEDLPNSDYSDLSKFPIFTS